tara:strand:+ start:234 stop:2765 length:2532 start_codon:yes stop_codon:yes gene_type:complete
MNVMNRKLFANRDARQKLASMGGIVTSSPELINTVQSFRKGGRTITFGNTKLVLFDDGEMYAELEDGRRVKLNEAQKAEIKALLEIRNERRRDEVLEKGATAKGPDVFADTLGDIGYETISPEVRQEVDKQSQVLDVLKRGKGIREAAIATGLTVADVLDVAAGTLGVGINEIIALGTEGLAAVLNAAGLEGASRTAAEQAGELREAGRDFVFKEEDFNLSDPSTYPRVVGLPSEVIKRRTDEAKKIKETSDVAPGIGPGGLDVLVKGALTTKEQRAKIAEQSDAAIKRASAETLRDTGESVPFTGRTDLLSVEPKSGVMSSLGGSEVLFDLLQGKDTVPDKTASVGFEGGDRIAPPVRSPSGFGEGIMSQAPGISVPNVDIGETGLERAREIAERDAAIRNALQDPRTSGITDFLDKVQNDERISDVVKQRVKDDTLYDPKALGAVTTDKTFFPDGDDPQSKAISDLNQRALQFLRTDTSVPLSEIYGDVIGGDVRAIAKYQGASPEEVQAISDRLAREAAAEEAAKEQGFYDEKDEEIQSEYDKAIAKQQAILDADADAAALEDLKTTAKEIKEKKEEEKKIDPKTLPVLGEEDTDADAKAAQEKSFSLSDAPKKIQKNLKKNSDDPAGAVTKTTLNDEGIDTSNMSLKERVKSMRGVLSELIGDSDEDKNEEFWLAMARIGFGVAAGEDPSALKNIADGLLDGINEIAKDRKADKKRDDDLTLAAFDMVRQDDRDALNYQRQIGLIDARQRATQDEDISNAFRLQKNAYVKSLTDMVPKYGTGSDTSIEEINRQATNLAFQDLATQFSPTVLKQSTLYQSPSNKTFIDNAIEALNAQQYL